MAVVTWRSDRAVDGKLLAFVGNKLQLKAIPSKGEKVPFEISVAPSACAVAEDIVQRAKANFTTFTLSAVGRGSAQLQLKANGKPVSVTYPIDVNDPLVLPPANKDAGLIVRVLLAETPPPKGKEQKAAVLEAMRLMRVVMENRLAKPSAVWGSAGAKSLADVVRAPRQFAGFGEYPKIAAKIARRLDELLSIANDGNDTRQGERLAHVEMAIGVATGTKPQDPTSGKLYWWRTENSGPPSKDVKFYKSLANNTFYTTE